MNPNLEEIWVYLSTSPLLGLTLTQRNGIPMCGLPFHAATPYISRLINAGYRVALCDQMETPKPGQMVRREITQIISPGSVVEIESLDSRGDDLGDQIGRAHV